VLVVGGGRVATRRALSLLEAGAVVEVVSPDATTDLAAAAESGRLTWHVRGYGATDPVRPERAWLVHTATGTPVDAQVAADCERVGVWCVRAADAGSSAAWTPAVARGAPGSPAEGLVVAVTGGGDPRRASAVRDAVAAGLESGTLPVRRHRRAEGGQPTDRVGRVFLVGGGPGAPGLVTVRGRALLAAADVVVVDRLGPRELLDTLGPDVEVVDVGKTPRHHPIPQERINEILVEHALAGKDVVRLKGGDPFVLGRGGEEALHCAAHGVPVEVVVVGDAPRDERLSALTRAAREAVVNAAKHSGAPVVQVYAEVEATQVTVFVRDRGRGFDPRAVPADRFGLAESVVGRVVRAGGEARVTSAPGEGTEVRLQVSRV